MNATRAEAPSGWTGRRALSETALVNVAVLAIGALTGIITARILGPDGRGTLALALAVAGVMTVAAGLGLQQALAYKVAAQPDSVGEAIALSIWAGVIVGGLAAVAGIVVAGLIIRDDSAASAVRLALLTVPISAIGGGLAGTVQGMRAARPFNLLRLATPAGFAALLTGGVLTGWELSPVDIVLLYLVAAVASAGVAIAVVRRWLDLRRTPSRAFTRTTLRYGLVVNIGSLAWTANRQLALVVLAAVATLRDVGLFSVAIGYATPVGVAALALALHTLPDVAAEKDRAAQVALARRRLGTTVLITLPLTVGGVLAAPFLVPLAFGDAFSEAVGAAQFLVLAQALLGVNHVLSEISRGLARPGLPAVADGLGAAATILMLPVVVPAFGLAGAAAGTALVFLVVGLVLCLGLRASLTPA
jgi:O-antigen/teichoic acid export membrane protein